MKRKILAFILVGALGMFFTSCSSAKSQEKEIDILSVGTKIMNEIKLEDTLTSYDVDIIQAKYGYATQIKKNSVVFGTATMASPEEIAIFKTSDEKESEQIKTAIQNRIEDLKFSFSNYGNIESNNLKLESALMFEKNNYILFVVAHPDEIKKSQAIFEDSLK